MRHRRWFREIYSSYHANQNKDMGMAALKRMRPKEYQKLEVDRVPSRKNKLQVGFGVVKHHSFWHNSGQGKTSQ